MKIKIQLFLLLFSIIVHSQTKKTFTYAIKGTDTLKLDIYTPDDIQENDNLPLLLWIHGGGFSGGARDSPGEVQLMEYASNNNYIATSISYRLLRKGEPTAFDCNCTKQEKLDTFKQGVIDYLDAASFLVKNADSLQIDTNRIIAGGSSAGAEVALDAVFMREYFIEDLSTYNSVKFAALFSLAGAMVNADYITKENAVPSVLFHGTDDNLVPFASAPHHYCKPSDSGYLFLDGSKTIADKLEELKTSYYFNIVEGGKHEVSSVPTDDFDAIFRFIKETVLNENIIQTTVIKNK